MGVFDAILVIALFLFFAYGWRFGFIRTVGILFGTIAGAVAAGMFFETLASYFGGGNLARVSAFLVIFVAVHRLVGFVFMLVARLFSIVSFIPFTRSLNTLAGGLFGLAVGVLTIGIVVTVLSAYSLHPAVDAVLEKSDVTRVLVFLVTNTIPFFETL